MTTNTQAAALRIEQRHRDAAADYMTFPLKLEDFIAQQVRDGHLDSDFLVRAFARFEQSLPVAGSAVREALRQANRLLLVLIDHIDNEGKDFLRTRRELAVTLDSADTLCAEVISPLFAAQPQPANPSEASDVTHRLTGEEHECLQSALLNSVTVRAVLPKPTNPPSGQLQSDHDASERARIVAWLRDDAQMCDCSARSEDECGCGAWWDAKTVQIDRIIEAIGRGDHLSTLQTRDAVPPPPGSELPAGREDVLVKWADDSDPEGELAIALAASAIEAEENVGEWTWRDIARAAIRSLKGHQ